MLADTSKSLAEELGILEGHEKVAYRATFIIDPQGIVRWERIFEAIRFSSVYTSLSKIV